MNLITLAAATGNGDAGQAGGGLDQTPKEKTKRRGKNA